MSARAQAWAWRQTPATAAQKLVLMALADVSDDDGGHCWPSLKWLETKCAPVSLRTARRAVSELVEQGLLEKVERRRRRDGTLGTWVYRMPVDEDLTSGHKGPPVDTGERAQPVATSGRAELDLLTKRRTPPTDVGGANGAQKLVSDYVDRSRALGSDPPRRVKGQVASLVGEMLGEGIPPERILAGIGLLLDRRLHPSTLPSCVHEAGLPPPLPRPSDDPVDRLFAQLRAEIPQ